MTSRGQNFESFVELKSSLVVFTTALGLDAATLVLALVKGDFWWTVNDGLPIDDLDSDLSIEVWTVEYLETMWFAELIVGLEKLPEVAVVDLIILWMDEVDFTTTVLFWSSFDFLVIFVFSFAIDVFGQIGLLLFDYFNSIYFAFLASSLSFNSDSDGNELFLASSSVYSWRNFLSSSDSIGFSEKYFSCNSFNEAIKALTNSFLFLEESSLKWGDSKTTFTRMKFLLSVVL